MQQPARTYEIDRILGRGGFGTVYAARMIGTGGFVKQVALKVLNAEMSGSVEIVQRLRDEARMLGLLKHRAIVHVEGLVQIDDRWAVVMELVEGASLAEVVQHTAIPPACALEIAEEVASALDVAYSRPTPSGEVLALLHRDIKPSNIQLTPTGEVKLLDFGVARAEFGGREAETRSVILGSLAYLAPERLDAIDSHAGDIYALGATLFELLTGEQLGRTSANWDKHRDHIACQMSRCADLDPAISTLLRSCLNYDEADRPTASALARELRVLRRTHSEPWLRDWAEEIVPDVQTQRPSLSDDWSGATLHEGGARASGSSDTMALNLTEQAPPSLDPDPGPTAPGGRRQARPTFETSPTPSPERIPPPAEPAPNLPGRSAPSPKDRTAASPPRAASRGRGFCLAGLILALLLSLGTLGVVIAVPTALISLISVTGVWETAWIDAVGDSMDELELKVRGCDPSPERDRVKEILQRARRPDAANKFGFLSLAMFDIKVSDAAVDRRITQNEARDIEDQFTRITGIRLP